MRKIILVEYLLLVICMLLPMLNFGQEVKQNPEVEKVLRLLNIHRDEQLTRAELKERLRLGRILQHVFQGDTMVFNPEQAESIKLLPAEYVEYTKSYFRLMNDLLKSLDTHQRWMMGRFWQDYDITTPVMIGFLRHDTRLYRLSVTKEEVLEMMRNENNDNARVDTVYMPTSMYRDDVSSIFFPSDVIIGLDRGKGMIYRRFKNDFFAMIELFKKQFKIKE